MNLEPLDWEFSVLTTGTLLLLLAYWKNFLIELLFLVLEQILFTHKNMANFDADLSKAFKELQVKVITTTQQVKLAEAQIAQLSRNITHAKLTDQELSLLPNETRTYQAVGRMFILEPIDQIRSDLKKKIEDGESKIKTIEKNKEQLQKSVKDHENSIREMLATRR